MYKRKIFLSFMVLGSLMASLALAVSMFGKGIQHSFAHSPGVTVTDFTKNSGQEALRTAFDAQIISGFPQKCQ